MRMSSSAQGLLVDTKMAVEGKLQSPTLTTEPGFRRGDGRRQECGKQRRGVQEVGLGWLSLEEIQS